MTCKSTDGEERDRRRARHDDRRGRRQHPDLKHADFLAEAVALIAAQLMEAEITQEIGAARGEVFADRATHRNGYRPRRWETRVGELDLLVPRKRSGEAYFPSFLDPAAPAEEQAIVSVS